MDRLTRRDKVDGNEFVRINKGAPDFIVYEKLAEYEDLEQQGKLLKLPVAVGDYVWFWDKDYDPIEEAPFYGYVSGYEVVSSKTVYILINPITDTPSWLPHYVKLGLEEFGKTVFLTKKSAEAALKEMSKE